jgi:hypothetical protein
MKVFLNCIFFGPFLPKLWNNKCAHGVLEGFLVYQEWRKGPIVWDLLKGFPELFFTQSMFMFRILKVEMTSKKKWNTSLKPIISILNISTNWIEKLWQVQKTQIDSYHLSMQRIIPENIPNAHNYKADLASYYYGARLPTRFQRSHVPS